MLVLFIEGGGVLQPCSRFSTNYLFCKIRHDDKRFNNFVEHLSGGIYGCFNDRSKFVSL